MKAVRYHSYGDSSVLAYEDADRPAAGPGQVVVKVAGAAFNPVDVAIRAGFMQQVFPVALPHIPNFDVSGVIDEVGEGVSGWSAGDAVVAFLAMTAPGAAAEYVTVPAEVLAAAPRTVELADAAALPSASLTASQALFEHADVKPGQSVLINGAGGAVGGYAVQLAKQAGAIVTATASASSAGRVRSYGADRSSTTPPPRSRRRWPGSGSTWCSTWRAQMRRRPPALADLTADGGTFVITTGPAPDPGRGVRAVQMFARSDAAQLGELVARVDAGDLTIHVAQRRPLADLPAVHDQAAAGELPGKTILIP